MTMSRPLPHASAQSRAASLVEAIVNVIVGLVLAVLVQLGAYPPPGIAITIARNGLLAPLFTALSLVCSDAVRRMFLAESGRRERAQRAAGLERRLATGRLPMRHPHPKSPLQQASDRQGEAI